MTGTAALTPPAASLGLAEPSSDGVVFAMRFGTGGTGTRLTPGRPLRLSDGDHGFVWIHLSLADVRALNWLARQPELDSDIVETMTDTGDAPRVELAGEVQAGVLADLMLEIDHPTDEPARLAFALGPDFPCHRAAAAGSSRSSASSAASKAASPRPPRSSCSR